ncbi:hypothetical protein WJX73_007955 [Symbiochloris irregularis]|uniref:E3 ubiquitin-protein ligase SHPRH n=1 Tax=Symbiochloris irregularis TaxID=706552 RepID=A0AAW1PCD6_9CHLO
MAVSAGEAIDLVSEDEEEREVPQATLREQILQLGIPRSWTATAANPPGLTCDLKPYQSCAVQWMLSREAGIVTPEATSSSEPGPDVDNEHHMLLGGILADEMGLGKTVECIAVLLHNPFHPVGPQPAAAADAAAPEALAEANTAAELAPAQEAMAAGTLIVTPPAIRRQWEQELRTHAPGVSVAVYEGLKYYKDEDEQPSKKRKPRTPKGKEEKLKAGEDGWQKVAQVMSAGIANGEVNASGHTEAAWEVARLRSAAVVLTTYDVLQREVYFSPNKERLASLRSEKRYVVPESPLLTLRWLRAAFDEAQKAGTGSVALMTQRLSAKHRWVVTGTPIGRGGLKDILALLRALNHYPMGSTPAWLPSEQSLADGDQVAWRRLKHLLQPIMWRNTKASVSSDLQLPSCSVQVDRLKFTAAEWTFYQRILDDTRAFIKASASETGASKSSIPGAAKLKRSAGKSDKLALQQLLQLRYCCDHPQLTLYWRRLSAELQLQQGGALSMVQGAWEALTESQAVGEHGIAELEGQGQGFGSMYLTTASHRAWRLIQVNTLTHLSAVLRAKAAAADLDQQAKADLLKTADELQDEISKKSADVAETPALALAAARSAKESCTQACEDVCARAVKRWQEAGEQGFQEGYHEKVQAWIGDLRARFAHAQESERAARQPVENAEGAQQVLLGTVVESLLAAENPRLLQVREGLEGAYLAPRTAAAAACLRAALASLTPPKPELALPQPGQVDTAALPWPIPMQVDPLGKVTWPALNHQGDVDVSIKAADELALTLPSTLLDQQAVTRSVVRAARALDKQHKKLKLQKITYLQSLGLPEEDWPSVGTARLAYEGVQAQLDVLKRLRELHVAELKAEVAQSELESVQASVAAAAEGVPEMTRGKGLVAVKNEIERLKEQCREQLQRQRFLENQRAELQPPEEAPTTDGLLMCGICFEPVQGRFWLFECAHYFCEKCSLTVFGEARKVSCPTCRAEVRADRVFRGAASVKGGHRGGLSEWEHPQYIDTPVLGDWMSKIEGLLRRLVHFCKEEPDVKHLVFSQFPDALKMVAKALAVQQPPISCVSLLAGGSTSARSNAVSQFRDVESVRVFLLSLNAGASGLTLVRASEVWLLEPSVDPAVEQQAIARVHRIGQVRPVVAHRMLMDGTIEEEVLRVAQRQHAGLGSSDAGGADMARGGRENLQQHQVRGLLDAALAS